MNIDLLCEFGSMNGGENSLVVLLPLLQKRGVRFRVLAPPEGPFAETVRSLGIELVPFHAEPNDSLEKRRSRLADLLKQNRPDILHANSLSMGRLSGPVTQELVLPSLSHIRDIIRLNRTVIDDLNRHRRLLAVSEATKSFHVAQGVDESRCKVMYNGVDLSKFKPRDATGYFHREQGIPATAKFLGVIGQIGLRKGLDRLMPVLRNVFARNHDVHLVVIGRRWSEKDESVQFEESLRREAESDVFHGRVHFPGVRTDVDQLMNELTILVHPARQEPLGRVLLEAAASGLCVVATDVGGTREIFFDPQTERCGAILIPDSKFESFSDEIEKLLVDEKLRANLARIARHRMETAFSMETAAERLFGHYSETEAAS